MKKHQGSGTKRKIPSKKIQKKNSLATSFTKSIGDLYSEASELCLLSGAQMAILATSPSSQSNVSCCSFGHSSADSIVTSFLSGKNPVPTPIPSENKQMREDIGICLARKELGLGFWWEDESLEISKNPEELQDAIDSMSILLSNAKKRLSEYSMKNQDFEDIHEESLKKDETSLPQNSSVKNEEERNG